MSSFTLIRIRLKNVSAELLRQVVEQLCKDLGGTMTTTITDYYGNPSKVSLGFTCPQHTRGVGFEVVNGQVQMKADFYMHHEFQQQLERSLTQTYTAQAHQQALRQAGFQVQSQKVGEKIVLRAFSW